MIKKIIERIRLFFMARKGKRLLAQMHTAEGMKAYPLSGKPVTKELLHDFSEMVNFYNSPKCRQ